MEEEKLKKYKKFVNFYQIHILPSFRDTTKSDKQVLFEILKRAFKDSDSLQVESIQYDKISLDEEYFFGCIHKISSIDILTEIRSKSDMTLEKEDIFLESCTYFYIDFEKLGLSVIKTQRIQNSTEFIKKFIEYESSLHIEITPFKKSKEEINQLLINSITMTFSDGEFVELNDINKADCEFSEYTVSAKLTKVSNSFLPQLIKKYKDKKSLKKLAVSTENEDVDLIKNIFTKQVSIELTKNYKNDLDKIKETLKIELLKIINT